jgi:hypothetical protein
VASPVEVVSSAVIASSGRDGAHTAVPRRPTAYARPVTGGGAARARVAQARAAPSVPGHQFVGFSGRNSQMSKNSVRSCPETSS